MKISNNRQHLHISIIRLTIWIIFSILISGFLVHICHQALHRELKAELEEYQTSGDGISEEDRIYQEIYPLIGEVNLLLDDLRDAGKKYTLLLTEDTEASAKVILEIDNTENQINEQLKEISSASQNSAYKDIYENMVAKYVRIVNTEAALRHQLAFTIPASENMDTNSDAQEINRLKSMIQNKQIAINELNQKNDKSQVKIRSLENEKLHLKAELQAMQQAKIKQDPLSPVKVNQSTADIKKEKKLAAARVLIDWWNSKKQFDHRNKSLPLTEVKLVYEGFKNNEDVLIELEKLIKNL